MARKRHTVAKRLIDGRFENSQKCFHDQNLILYQKNVYRCAQRIMSDFKIMAKNEKFLIAGIIVKFA